MRLRRLAKSGNQRLLVVPMDHPISDGPLAVGKRGLDNLVDTLSRNGADAVVLHKGSLRQIDPFRFANLSLIVHLSASSSHAPDPDQKVLVTSVIEALRLGADAVSVHVNVGSSEEAAQLRDLGQVAAACDEWNMPLLAMMYPRGPKIADPAPPELIAHIASIAVELGADLVKLPFAGSVQEMGQVVAGCPIPILVAGGPRPDDDDDVKVLAQKALTAGVAGLSVGRSIFEAPDPGRMTKILSSLVHQYGQDKIAEGVMA
uniref:2-amino-3,7-dideoxy-D-threo-hept-6-ulosonate synthase n=1 Tax=Paractinoplanes polyasparticus TaxID=2856853 RepID=UPI00210552C0|nr:2-amino-3,7-dideoxy-D-threo-hept-6-ulosonate synthase [Actinoplanes polyasparticus]